MTHEQLRRIHEGGLRVLEQTGASFRHRETLDLFAAHGFRVDGDRVRMTAEQVASGIAAVPATFTLESWNPRRNLTFGGGSLVTASVAGPTMVAEGGAARPATDADLVASVRLTHVLPNLDMIGFPLEPQDIPAAKRYVRPITCALSTSDKPVEYALSTAAHVRVTLDTSEIVHGAGWHERPRAFTILNPVSPLRYEEDNCAAILDMARRRQPLCITNCVMGGTTGPITVAGLLVQQHAEVLAGLVLAQLAEPGCPFVYGGLSAPASMVTGDPLFGTPEYWMVMKTTVELARWLGLPVRAGAAVTDSHVPDMQAAIESTMGLILVIEAGVDFVLHAAGAVGALNAVSFEKMLIDDELLGMLRALREGFPLDDDALAVDLIDRVGPGGNFLLEDHTAAHCRDSARPSFFNRRSYAAWLDHGGRDLVAEAAVRLPATLAAYEDPGLDATTRRQLETYAAEYGA